MHFNIDLTSLKGYLEMTSPKNQLFFNLLPSLLSLFVTNISTSPYIIDQKVRKYF